MAEETVTDVARAFGAENRARLLRRYFDEVSPEEVAPPSAWRHTYRLLMWLDRTIGLAHCYESDKCQPGRPWYARSLRFHQWLSGEFGVAAGDLGDSIDWLFTSAVQDLARASQARAGVLRAKADVQRAPYEGEGMPLPGDPELEALIEDILSSGLGSVPPPALIRELSERIKAHMSGENKRKNLVGEGFEDTLAELLRRLSGVADSYEISVRPVLHALPGFNPPRGGEKTKKVDLALVSKGNGRRILVSCKWSVRSDREEQFATDFDAYARLESSGSSFDYVLITNEFDPARLAAACDMRSANQNIFTNVVHVNPDGPRTVYDVKVGRTNPKAKDGVVRAIAHIDSNRIESLENWLTNLSVPVD